MSKSLGDLLREMDAKWNDGLAHPMPTLMWPEQVKRIAAVLDAADAMKEWVPRAADYTGRGKSVLAYDAARAALAEALKEGR